DLREDARGAEPVAGTLERGARQDLEPEHAAVEILGPLGVSGHQTFVLHPHHVGAGHRTDPLFGCHCRHGMPPRGLSGGAPAIIREAMILGDHRRCYPVRAMAWRVGIDVGGTFTDLAAVDDASGAVHLEKVPTTPADQSVGVAAGLATLLARHGVLPAAVGYLGHGTTVCINAVLERKGARTGLVTTHGMRDLLELRRQIRDDLYDLQADKPEPLVPRDRRHEVPERTLAEGSVATPVDMDAVHAAIGALVAEGVEALAVCFLHSYVNPAHERAVAERARREFPDLYLSLSSDVLREFREFERLSTTVMNAYVGPVMARSLRRFEERVATLGLGARPLILQSNGGVATVDQVSDRPVSTMASGPTAGVAGAAYLAARAGDPRIITFDMGGTSTDVSVVEQGTPVTAAEKSYHGYPVKAAMIDVDSIGAGGGSLACIDSPGFLRVRPPSPGPVPRPPPSG